MTAATIDLALALAVLVVVPLALRLDGRRRLQPGHLLAVVGAGAVAALSLLVDAGAVAAGLAIPWLGAVAALALRHAFPFDLRALLRDALVVLSSAYLVVGAGWFVLSRYAARLLDFDDTIVELTAVHFHYAGFVAPVLVHRLAVRLRRDGRSDAAARAALVAVLVATPLTAAGITFEPALGAAGAALFAAGLTVASVLTLRWVVPPAGAATRALLAVSSLSVIASMTLAVAYALGHWLGTAAPSLPVMVRTHGVLNAAGFALAGVLGWLREERATPPAPT
ncbi:MAG TPA: YndJ family transporter [Actinomycetota bacterium]|nr:YndJ family transporter [Actinomycetota bacterium]